MALFLLNDSANLYRPCLLSSPLPFSSCDWPGGPDAESVSPEVMAQLKAHYHMDRPLLRQYWDYVSGLAGSISALLQKAFAHRAGMAVHASVSIELGIYALAFSLAIGWVRGILSSPGRTRCSIMAP